MSDPRVVVRVAIALTILKHKPRDRSTASYLLDLQSHFPVATQEDDSRRWRRYALELEEQLATLKAQHDADQELLSKLPTNVDVPPPKKKSKKNPSSDPEWSWDQTRADWSRVLSSQYPSSPSLVAAYASLRGVLAAPNSDLLPHLSDAIIRALDTIHVFSLSQHIDSTRISLASPLLVYVLRTALHTLVRTAQESKRTRQRARSTSSGAHAYIDKVINHLLECVLLPLVRAVTPLCSARLAPLVTPPPKVNPRRATVKDKGKGQSQRPTAVTKTADVRADVFAFIGTSLAALDALPPSNSSSPVVVDGGNIARGVRDRVGLEVIRALEALYVPPPATPSDPSPSTSHPLMQPSRAQRLEKLAGTRAERIRALAMRDAGWHLASVLNLCVTAAPAPGGRDALRDTLLDRIGRLVRSAYGSFEVHDAGEAHLAPASRHTCGPDPVCRNMLLAICERVMSHLGSP